MGIGIINLYQATPVTRSTCKMQVDVVLPLCIAIFGAVFFMNNLTLDPTVQGPARHRRPPNALDHGPSSTLGTFGSFIGYSAAFPC